MAPPNPGGLGKRQPLQWLTPSLDDPGLRKPRFLTFPGLSLDPRLAQSLFGNAGVANLAFPRPFSLWLGPTPADGFKKEFENQFVPNEIQGRVTINAPSLQRGVPDKPVTLLFDMPVDVIGTDEPTTLYAIPESELFETEAAALLPPGEERDRQSLLGMSPRIRDPQTGMVAGRPGVVTTTPPTTAQGSTGASTSAPRRLYTRAGPVNVIARADGFGITGEFHKLAVGAASTTVAKTPRGLIVIDAGIAGGANGTLADATIAKLKRIAQGKPILDLLSTHAHLDHTNLFKRIFGEFEVLSLHLNVAQAMQPSFKSDPKTPGVTFDEFKDELAREQRQFLEKKVREEVLAERSQWEKTHDVPEQGARESQWKKFVEEQVTARLAARQVVSVHLQVPGAGGDMHVVSAPIDKIDVSKVEFAPGQTTGVVQKDAQSAIVNKNLADAAQRQKEKGGKEAIDVDRYATSYVLIVDKAILALVLPDLRVNDIDAIRKQLKAEMTRLGRTAELRVWDIGHHLQEGFLGASASKDAASGKETTLPQARASQLLKLTEVLHELANVKNAQGAQPSDVVSVSVSRIDPALAWLLRSMGFELAPAVKGQDVRLIEAVTATGRRVKGLVGGLRHAVAGPSDPLMRRAHAAVEELSLKANDFDRQANKLRKRDEGTLKEKERLRGEATKAREQAKTIQGKAEKYVKAVNDALTTAEGKPRPAADVPAEPAAAEAAALRGELTTFDRPVVGRLGTFSDVAVVILGGEIPADARADLRALDEVRRIEAELEVATKGAGASPELRGRHLAALERKRNVVRRRLAEADRQGQEAAEERKVLRDELKVLDGEVSTALRATQGEKSEVFKRRLPNGKVVETRIELPKRPSVVDRTVRTGAEVFGRGMGAVMVYQLLRGEAELEARYQKGEVNLLEAATATAHNLYGISIGARMLGAVHVAPGEFVVMAALDIAQTALHEYDTSAQRNTAIAYSVIRNALTLGLMVAGQALMETGHPLGIIAGIGIMFLADPILEAFGVYDWLERKFEFLPDEVVGVVQKLRKLLEEYHVVVGALQIARRDDKRLAAVGAANPTAARKAATELVASRRDDARQKEAQLLVAFLQGYEEAKKSYGGLPELDQYRAEFLKLMIEAHGEEAPKQKSQAEIEEVVKGTVFQAFGVGDDPGHTARERADAMFHLIEQGMTLEKMSSEQIAEMSQWSKMDDWMDKIRGELAGKETADVDWKDVAEKVGELDQMFASARYRLDPSASGDERVKPLLPEKSPGRFFYERELRKREKRFLYLRETLAESAGGKKQPAAPGWRDKLVAKLNPWAHAFPSTSDDFDVTITLEATLANAEAAVESYRKALKDQPGLPPGLTAESIASHSWEAGSSYPEFVNWNGAFKSGLFRMKTLELAMRTSIGQALALGRDASTTVTDQQKDRLRRLPIEARKVIEERREEKGFLFLDEAKARVPEIRAQENVDLAALLGQPKDVEALTGDEQLAAGKGDLEDMHLTTIQNRLAQIPQLRFPSAEQIKKGDVQVFGVYKVVGEYDYTDLLITRFGGTTVEASDNVLVGYVREGGEGVSGEHGHVTKKFVVPLNDAAIRLFGGVEPVRLMSNILWPATVDDIRTLK